MLFRSHTAGLLSEQQYAAEKLKIAMDAADKKRKLEEDEIQAEINVRKAAAEEAKKALPGMHAATETAMGKSITANTNVEVARNGLEIAKENTKTAAEALKKWEEEHKKSYWGGLLPSFQDTGTGGTAAGAAGKIITPGQRLALVAAGTYESTLKDITKQFDQWVKLQTNAKGTAADQKKEYGNVAKAETYATEASAAFTRKEDAEEAENTLVTKTAEDVKKKEAELAAKKKADAATSQAERDAGKQKLPLGVAMTDLAGGDMKGAIATALKMSDTAAMYRERNPGVTARDAAEAVRKERGESVTGEEQNRMIDLASRIAGHKTDLTESMKMMDTAAQDSGVFIQDVGRLVRIMENLAKNLGPMHGRVDALESQVRDLSGQMASRGLNAGG